MRRTKNKKCRHCRLLFEPDHRNREKQDYCEKIPCRQAVTELNIAYNSLK